MEMYNAIIATIVLKASKTASYRLRIEAIIHIGLLKLILKLKELWYFLKTFSFCRLHGYQDSYSYSIQKIHRTALEDNRVYLASIDHNI